MHSYPRYLDTLPIATAVLLVDLVTSSAAVGQQLTLTVSTDKPRRSGASATELPEPFEDSTTIEYVLGVAADVRLEVFDAMGRRLRSLAAGRQLPGTYRVDVHAADLAGGVYLCRLTAGDHVRVRQMTAQR
jgi:hypothetical protein